jgi:hypothetical protein
MEDLAPGIIEPCEKEAEYISSAISLGFGAIKEPDLLSLDFTGPQKRDGKKEAVMPFNSCSDR